MRWLLPEHIDDILPAEAMRIESLRRLILDLFFKSKYQLVMPPLVEFTDSLLTDGQIRFFGLTSMIVGLLLLLLSRI